MDLLKLSTVKFEFEEYSIWEGMKIPPHPILKIPPHPILKDFISFNLSVENCRITEVRMLYRIIADQLKVETEIIERKENEGISDVHPLQYSVREFLRNILAELEKIDGIDKLEYYIIKTR